MKFFSELLEKCKESHVKRVPVVVCAHEDELLKAILRAKREGIITEPILVGDREEIVKHLLLNGADLDDFQIVHGDTKEKCSEIAIQSILSGAGDFLVKGLVDTSIILKAILNRKEDLAKSKGEDIFFSHVTVAELDSIDRVIAFGDAAMNILPDVESKIKIIENCYSVWSALHLQTPKIALLAAKEHVSKKMIATTDAHTITKKLAEDERFIVEGPLSLDNALSKKSAEIKGIAGKIQGDADILIMPNIEAGNIFYKSLCYLTKSKTAGVLVGAKIPIVITSRADSEESKFLSIVLASVI
ncbi:MAG: phosphate acyltransferase [Cetobacterium sp.]|uniref:phosphate acyltransferase n=3 Tax=Cetobacterium sp. TaxID=2071632 RepID=UPI003F30EFDE